MKFCPVSNRDVVTCPRPRRAADVVWQRVPLRGVHLGALGPPAGDALRTLPGKTGEHQRDQDLRRQHPHVGGVWAYLEIFFYFIAD